ncbi:MAG: transposase, partial [Coriobacteriales bacterium]|nr:transposase [Coriobacteriales bacterium]
MPPTEDIPTAQPNTADEPGTTPMRGAGEFADLGKRVIKEIDRQKDAGLISEQSVLERRAALDDILKRLGDGELDPQKAFAALEALMPPAVVKTDDDSADGLNKCPRCGSAEIFTQPGTGRLQCSFCRHVFDAAAPAAMPVAAGQLHGEARGGGATDIDAATSTQVTIECQGCGAEVVIDANESMTARCHWCRQTLSLERQIPNGAVPDLILPFLLSKEQAQEKIRAFVKKRALFANGYFKLEFTTDNIVGVYLPYLVVNAQTTSDLR